MRWISSRLFYLCVFSSALAAHADDFCRTRGPDALPATIEKISTDPGMRLGFKNSGGMAGGGVCWWHSRFQRAAWYLARFDESAPAPSREAAKAIVRKLVARNEVVVIPGYRDLESFSKDFKPEIQSALNAWQIRDAVINQAYLRGLSGRARFRDPAKMKARLDRVYSEFLDAAKRGEVLWLMLQMRGIDSHASLLHSMEPSPDGGYRIALVDSNFPGILVEDIYRPGDLDLLPSNVKVGPGYASVPYAGFKRDLVRIRGAIARYCSR